MKKKQVQADCLEQWDLFCNREISLDEMVDSMLRVSKHHKAPDKVRKNIIF